MEPTLTRLYPSHAHAVRLRGLYLAHRLHELGTEERPFVYANFVTSLDGRIALRNPLTGQSKLPRALTSENDLRLLLELQAQADCIVTHAGYLRAIADGLLGDILQVGKVAGHEDLAPWREANGLPRQPAICIASASLEFPLPLSVDRDEQTIFVATGRRANPSRIEALERAGYEVVVAGETADVEGAPLARALARKGFRSVFLLAGPRMLDTTLRDRVLSRFYLTITHDLLGGEHFHSLLEGPAVAGAGRLRLTGLHLDTSAQDGPDQWFVQFEPRPRGSRAGDHSHSSSA